jgi:DNA polymerase-3 subunit epsilon
MLLAIIDTETTGIDENARLLEVGLVLFDTKSLDKLIQISTLIPQSLDNQGEIVNSISSESIEAITKLQKTSEAIKSQIISIANTSDFAIAHSAEFDKRFLPEITAPWLCTFQDFRFPKVKKLGSLVNLAVDHRVPIVNAHRALEDCNLIANIFQTYSTKDLESMVDFASQKNITVIAECSFEKKELAKDAGFKWDIFVNKKWAKIVKLSEYRELQETLGKKIRLVKVRENDNDD